MAPVGVDLKGAPAPPPCRIKIVWERNADTASLVKNLESSRPGQQELSYRDAQGLYSSEKPFWADITDARCVDGPVWGVVWF